MSSSQPLRRISDSGFDAERGFEAVQKDLHEAIMRLKHSPEHSKVRTELLRTLRLLLAEADQIIASEQDRPV
jgi:hypothetical protein